MIMPGRNGSLVKDATTGVMEWKTDDAGDYRYGFNGQENDNEVKGEGNQLDFGARVYDPRIGRFLSIDPEFGQFADYSPYSFAGNNPIAFIDENGEAPKPITSKEFTKIAAKLGVIGNKRVGELFERLAIRSAKTSHPIIHNTMFNYKSPVREKRNALNGGPKSVRPDGISGKVGTRINDGPISVEVGDSWYEAKATGAKLTRNYRQGQLEGMVDALYERMGDRNNASLTLFTTSDTKIGDDLKMWAAYNGVSLYQSVAALDDDGKIVFSNPELVNADQLNKLSIDIKSKDNYSTFKSVDPATETKGLTNTSAPATPSRDPDPAEVNDH